MTEGETAQSTVAGFLATLGWLNIVAAVIGVLALAQLYLDSFRHEATLADVVWIASIGIAGLTSGALLIGAAEGLRQLAQIKRNIGRSHGALVSAEEIPGAAGRDLNPVGEPLGTIQQAKQYLLAKGFQVRLQEDATLTFSAGVSRGAEFSRGFASKEAFLAFAEEIRRHS